MFSRPSFRCAQQVICLRKAQSTAAVICTEDGSCPVGQERAGHSITSAGTCTGCATGKYKDIVGIYTSVSQQFTACEKGTYLSGYTASNRGTCATCDNGKYKAAKGYYSDLCNADVNECTTNGHNCYIRNDVKIAQLVRAQDC